MNRYAVRFAALMATTALATPAFAQDMGSEDPNQAEAMAGSPEVTEDPIDEVVVVGVRGSQQASINLKRQNDNIVDAITAEDIGKLPDVTIVDSLQRISGVQITRSAGEGSGVNVRGLPQVYTLINGEQYLSPGNLGTAQPSLNDVPAQLVGGVVVYKSTDVRNALSGISGTLDLRTRRPFDFTDGITASGQIEGNQGQQSQEPGFLTSGLVNYRNGNFGALVSASYSDVTLGNNYAGWGGGIFGGNDWGVTAPNQYMAPHGYETFNRIDERKRLGITGAIQYQVTPAITATLEGFYTDFTEHDLKAGMNISNRWVGLGWTTATDFQVTPYNHWSGPWAAVDEYDLDAWWVNSFSVNRTIHSNSKDFSGELKYDNGGLLTGSIRGIYADADYRNTNGQVQGDLSNWQYYPDRTFTLFRNPADRSRGPFFPADIANMYPGQYSNNIVGSDGGRYVDPNPNGYPNDPQLHLDISNGDMRWSGFNTPLPGGALGPGASLADYMANLDSYRVAAFSSEGNNYNTSKMYAFRGDGSLDFDYRGEKLGGFLSRIDFGARASKRETEISVYHLFSNLYAGQASDPNGCAVQWKAIDVVLDNGAGCTAGEQVANPNFDPTQPVSADNPETIFQGYTAWRPTSLSEFNNPIFVTDFGSQTIGFPGIWVANPSDFNDPVAFQTRVFGNAYPVIIPGASYDVDFKDLSFYGNAKIDVGKLHVNAGLKAIRTTIDVRQNLTGATIPYGDTNEDIGDYFDGNEYWDYLPSVNATFDVNRNLKIRAAFSENMMPLDLGNYGGGLSIATNDSPCDPAVRQPSDAPCGVRQVTSASSGGNPQLEPWRSTNYDATIEYYLGRLSLFNVGIFKLDIESFVTTETRTDGQFPDGDGVIRRTVPFTRPVQGTGGEIWGVEAGAKLAFSDVLSTGGFLSNMGVDANFTYAPSKNESGGEQLNGEFFPFFDNSKYQYNAALWYQDDSWQARIAYNRRSPRLVGSPVGVALFQDTAEYVDANVTYNLNDRFSIYGNIANLTGEIEKYYYVWDDDYRQFSSSNEFERRYSLGVRAKF